MLNSTLKRKVYEACIHMIDLKLETIKNEFKLYQESAANETKSTAGDKHDTGKAMMQMEQEKLGTQLKELLNNKNILLSLKTNEDFKKANLGSLIQTNHGIFYLSISLGKVMIESKEIFAISMQSPLSKLIFNKVKNDVFEFNKISYVLQDIC